MKTILITLTCLFISANCFCQKSTKRGEFYILDSKKTSKAIYTRSISSELNTGCYLDIKIGGRILDSLDYKDIGVIITNRRSKEFNISISKGIAHNKWTSEEIARDNKKYEEEEEHNKMQKHEGYYLFKLPLSKYMKIEGRTTTFSYHLNKGKYYVRLKYEDPKTNKIYITNKMKLILK